MGSFVRPSRGARDIPPIPPISDDVIFFFVWLGSCQGRHKGGKKLKNREKTFFPIFKRFFEGIGGAWGWRPWLLPSTESCCCIRLHRLMYERVADVLGLHLELTYISTPCNCVNPFHLWWLVGHFRLVRSLTVGWPFFTNPSRYQTSYWMGKMERKRCYAMAVSSFFKNKLRSPFLSFDFMRVPGGSTRGERECRAGAKRLRLAKSIEAPEKVQCLRQ